MEESELGKQERPVADDSPPDLSTSDLGAILSARLRDRRVPDFDALNKEDLKRLEGRGKGQQRLVEIQHAVERLIEKERENGGTLRGTGVRKAAATQFGVSVWTIDNWMERYKADPCIESLIDKKRGRTPGGTFTAEQQSIIAYFYLNPHKQITGDSTGQVIIDGIEGVAYIQEILKMFTPSPPHSDHAVRRFMRHLKKDDPVMVTLAHRGKRYLESKLLPARRNDVKLPNERWQIDGRPLPIYIRHDGVVCTVTLLLIIDDYSQYPIRARLIPRMLRDEKGHLKRADFNTADVGILVASAIYYSGQCFATLYNDNGSQIIKIEDFLDG